MNTKYDIFVVADLCIDLLFTGNVRPRYGQAEQFIEDYTADVGGSAAIFASQFTKLGGKIGFLGKVGNDIFGDILLNKLKLLQISTEFVTIDKTCKTAVGVGLSDGKDRAMLTYLGSISALQPADIQADWIENTRHWHIAGYYLLEQFQDFWLEFLPELKKRGITVSLDTNWAPHGDWHKVQNILPFINVLLPNEEEAMLISGRFDTIEAGKALAQLCELVVVKCGAEGAIAFQKDKITRFSIPDTLTEDLAIVDTTGAGDNFDAGFMRNWLLNKPLVDCVHWGMKCGTTSLKAIGGITGQVQEIIL
ncbi:MAG: carbohydrate kinase family protein [Saprospiraceae bacterium]